MAERVTRVHREWRGKRLPLVGGAVLVVLGIWFLWHVRDVRAKVYAVAFVVGGAGAMVWATRTSGRGECPACDLWLHGLSLDENCLLCPHCHEYVEGKGGRLAKTAADAVASAPRYRTTVPLEAPVFPQECAVCHSPSERRVDLELVIDSQADFGTDLAVGVASLGTLKVVKRSSVHVAVPHCRHHGDGARLDAAALDALEPGPYVVFRSHRYMKSFCDLNGVRPV